MVQWMDQNGPVDGLEWSSGWFSEWIRMVQWMDQNDPFD